jgi:hypothetical protein
MAAHAGHEEDLVAPAPGEGLAHDLLALAVVVLPRVVHERDAGIHRLLHEAHGFPHAVHRTEVVAAQADDGDLDAGATEGTSAVVEGMAVAFTATLAPVCRRRRRSARTFTRVGGEK